MVGVRNEKVGTMITQNRTLAFIIIVIISFGLMMPRVISPQFGLFDDANTIITSGRILSGQWDLLEEAGTGRFRPVYWITYAILFGIAKYKPVYLYLINTIILVSSVICLFVIVDQISGRRSLAWISSSIFLLSSPIVENFYTLSKAEPLQVFWILGAMTIAIWGSPPSGGVKKVFRIVASAVLFLFALGTKETALVLAPIAIMWAIAQRVLGNRRSSETSNFIHIFLVASIVGVVLYLVIRFSLMPWGLTARGYTDKYSVLTENILNRGREWLDWSLRDFFYIMPLFVMPFIYLLRKKIPSYPGLMLGSIIWSLSWCIVFLPWAWIVEYFLYPFAIGVSILGAVLVLENLKIASSGNKTMRLVSRLFLLASTILFLLTLPNNYTNARTQLIIDAANAEVINYISQALPRDSTMFINIQEPNEYVDQMRLQIIEIKGRADLSVMHYRSKEDLSKGFSGRVYFALPEMENQHYLSVRMGVQAHTSKGWNDELLNELEGEKVQFEIIRSFQMLNVDHARLACPLLRILEYCDVHNTPFDSRQFSYGWKIFYLDL